MTGEVAVRRTRLATVVGGPRRRPWRTLTRGFVVLLFLLLAAGVWIVARALHARGELDAARAGVPAAEAAVRSGGGADVAQVARLLGHAQSAYDDTHDPVWNAAAALPVLGAPLRTVAGLTDATNAIAQGSLAPIAAAMSEIKPATLLTKGTMDVVALRRTAVPLTAAAVVLDQQRYAVAHLDGSWFAPVADARQRLLDAVNPLADTAIGAATAARLAPPMLGADGPRRYFVAFQNTAEARGTGGLLGAFAILVADHGKLTVERTGADSALPPFKTLPLGISAAFVNQYGALGATSEWLESNLSPDFPEVAGVWASMWKAATGQSVDGVLALDPRALATLLKSTGPVTAPGVGTVSAANVEQLVLIDQYRQQADSVIRKRLMVGVGTATIEALLHGKADFGSLSTGLAGLARDRHIQLYSAVPDEQELIVANRLAGAADRSRAPFAQAVVVNAGGNKLDTWLHSDLTYTVTQCADAARTGRTVDIAVRLRNDVPRSGLPAYVTVRSDKPPYPTVVGQNRVELEVLTTIGAAFQSATVDGVSVALAPTDGSVPLTLPDGSSDAPFLNVGQEAGHPSYGLDLELKPGATRTVVLRVREPAATTGTTGTGGTAPLLPLQPLANTPTARADVHACVGR